MKNPVLHSVRIFVLEVAEQRPRFFGETMAVIHLSWHTQRVQITTSFRSHRHYRHNA